MSRAIKRVLIEQAELDRMQQRQLREYLPELHSIANMYRKTVNILSRINLSDGEKLRQLYAINQSFNQLKSETNTLGSKPAVTPSKSASDAVAVAEEVATGGEQEATPAPGAPLALPTSPINIRSIKLQPNVRAKAANLLLTITANPQVMSRNATGELVLYGEPVVGSNFDAIFQAAFTGNSTTDLFWTDSFFKGLRTLRVSKSALLSRNFVKAYGSTPRCTHRGALALDEEEEEGEEPSAKRERDEEFKTPRRSQLPWSPPVKPRKSTRHQEGHGYQKTPPGWRPNVLYVY